MDGPVVKAAKRALEAGNVNLVLPWVHRESEGELKQAFESVREVRKGTAAGDAARELADLWFFETAVRLHRAGEGAPYEGIKPAGLAAESPAVLMADEAIEAGNPDKVIDFLTDAVKQELHGRFEHAISKKGFDENDVKAAREYVQAMLGFVLFAGHLHEYVKGAGSRSHGREPEGHERHGTPARGGAAAAAAAASPVGA